MTAVAVGDGLLPVLLGRGTPMVTIAICELPSIKAVYAPSRCLDASGPLSS